MLRRARGVRVAKPAKVRQTYRRVLRAVRESIPRVAEVKAGVKKQTVQQDPAPLLEVLRHAYAERTALAGDDAAAVRRAQDAAEDYAVLLESVRTHEAELLAGGWGVERDPKDVHASVARKVGLQMPKLYFDQDERQLKED